MKGLAHPKVKEILATVSAVPGTLSPEQFGGLLAKETRDWGEIVRAAGVKVE
jgi:tripartite-type tricarboxylate transporter receptor subunit TctC